MLPAALLALHFSPEPRVIIKVIESATLLGQGELTLMHLTRFRAAFPREYGEWAGHDGDMSQSVRELLQSASEASDGR
jgi:hypothetical protein